MTHPTNNPRAVYLGRTVHYVAYGTPGGEFPCTCRAAMVIGLSAAHPFEIDLCVFNPTGLFFNRGVRFHPGDPSEDGPGTPCASVGNAGDRRYPGGSWHLPEETLEGEVPTS